MTAPLYTAAMLSTVPNAPVQLPNDPGTSHAYRLLDELGIAVRAPKTSDDTLGCWARSGAMWLTGDRQPLEILSPLASSARGALLALQSLSPLLQKTFPATFSPECLLGERAAIAGYRRNGNRNCGNSSELLSTRNGVVALNLPRPEDWEQLPALLSRGTAANWPQENNWAQLGQCLAQQNTEDLLELGQLLGIAVANAANPEPPASWLKHLHPSVACPPSQPPLVVDLSALWAGPLCGSLLSMTGARVIKVESRNRPDGARLGPEPFFDLLNGGKSSLALDLPNDAGILQALLQQADIVIESSRPRALRQMGIDAVQLLHQKPGMIWTSITGYGRDRELAIAYGDDAGVAAGLSKELFELTGRYLFCGDAIADPLTGLHAAVATYALWLQGKGGLLDISLCAVTQYCRQHPTEPTSAERAEARQRVLTVPRIEAAAPRARKPTTAAKALGADNRQLHQELNLSC